jgi:hypothetical protein
MNSQSSTAQVSPYTLHDLHILAYLQITAKNYLQLDNTQTTVFLLFYKHHRKTLLNLITLQGPSLLEFT